jgi:hypothetical protein
MLLGKKPRVSTMQMLNKLSSLLMPGLTMISARVGEGGE